MMRIGGVQMRSERLIYARIPERLLHDLDEFRGNRSRTEVIRVALEGHLRAQRLLGSFREGTGPLIDETAEHWGTPEAVDRWVGTLRRGWNKENA